MPTLTPEQRAFVQELTLQFAGEVDKLEERFQHSLAPLLAGMQETNRHLVTMNGTVARLVADQTQQEQVNTKLVDCVANADKRITVLEMVTDLRARQIERDGARVEHNQEKSEDKAEERHRWTVGQIIALTAATATLASGLVQGVILLFAK